MKKIYTAILLAAFAGVMQAQLTLTKAGYEPALGDMMTQQQYDSTSVIPKSTGAGQTWNFNSFSSTTFTQATTYTTVASTPSPALFSSSTLAAAEVSGSNTKYEFYQSTSSTFEYQGSLNPSAVQTLTFSNSGTLMKWPVSIGSSNSDSFAGAQTNGTVTSSINGSVTYSATGAGTVILPGGNTHVNCLQVIETITLSVVTGTNTTFINQILYSYYSSSMKLPIFSVQYSAQTTGTVTSKSYNAELNLSATTVGIKEQSLINSAVLVYPNPAVNAFKVQLPDGGTASSIEVIDLTGRTVSRQVSSNTMDVSTLPKAAYFVRVTYKDMVIQKPIMITE